ncbi:unnamed protein product [Macrosiphum euphorbiae]|uniref:Transposase n=1 Tax=Macrosiphum euphorbiae TaxID=13131 RepID=A0AAV0Y1S8_9HEMI|nr:unnamed protein product [Macrosiphum euphorbiae]
MDLHSSKIIDFNLVQKGMGSGDLERKACESLIDKLIEEENCNIELFLTDRHRGIRYFLRTKYPQIEHEFDVWHLSKSLSKRLKGLDKKYPDAYLWKTSINNHLWWSSQTCNGDGSLLVEKFTSVLNHISNVHEWEDNGKTKKCEHEKLNDEDLKKKLWIHPNSESYFALKKIIMAKDLLKDLQHAKHFVHTGRLESYHNVRLKFMPKRIHLKFNGMYLGSIIAILDHNYNVNKTLIGDKLVFSKPIGRYTLKNRYKNPSNNWRQIIIENIKINARTVNNLNTETSTIDDNLRIPTNIVSIPNPNIDKMRLKKYSRFQK